MIGDGKGSRLPTNRHRAGCSPDVTCCGLGPSVVGGAAPLRTRTCGCPHLPPGSAAGAAAGACAIFFACRLLPLTGSDTLMALVHTGPALLTLPGWHVDAEPSGRTAARGGALVLRATLALQTTPVSCSPTAERMRPHRFRRVRVSDGLLTLNGNPVLFRGVNPARMGPVYRADPQYDTMLADVRADEAASSTRPRAAITRRLLFPDLCAVRSAVIDDGTGDPTFSA